MLRPYIEYDEEMKLLSNLQTYEIDPTSTTPEGINYYAIDHHPKSNQTIVNAKMCSGCRCEGLDLRIAIYDWCDIDIPAETQKEPRKVARPYIHALNGQLLSRDDGRFC